MHGVVLALGLTLTLFAQAQGMGGAGMPAIPEGMSPEVCEQLAAIPNPPMSVAACKAMFGMATSGQAAAANPDVRRPGDEALTCDQIFAELKSMAGVGLSEANLARIDTSVKEGEALANKQAAELTTFMVGSFALGQVMGAASAFMPNFVAAAIVSAWQASFVALGTKNMAEQVPVTGRMSVALEGGINELTRSMESNPRFAWLGQLAVEKSCEPPPEATTRK